MPCRPPRSDCFLRIGEPPVLPARWPRLSLVLKGEKATRPEAPEPLARMLKREDEMHRPKGGRHQTGPDWPLRGQPMPGKPARRLKARRGIFALIFVFL